LEAAELVLIITSVCKPESRISFGNEQSELVLGTVVVYKDCAVISTKAIVAPSKAGIAVVGTEKVT